MKIEIQNLCKTIKKVPILQDITVTFESGKIYGLKGKNGSGKTMLMRAISGLIIPNSGTINIDGEILGKDISFPRSIGILIENPSFLGNYTGYKNLEMLASIQIGLVKMKFVKHWRRSDSTRMISVHTVNILSV